MGAFKEPQNIMTIDEDCQREVNIRPLQNIDAALDALLPDESVEMVPVATIVLTDDEIDLLTSFDVVEAMSTDLIVSKSEKLSQLSEGAANWKTIQAERKISESEARKEINAEWARNQYEMQIAATELRTVRPYGKSTPEGRKSQLSKASATYRATQPKEKQTAERSERRRKQRARECGEE